MMPTTRSWPPGSPVDWVRGVEPGGFVHLTGRGGAAERVRASQTICFAPFASAAASAVPEAGRVARPRCRSRVAMVLRSQSISVLHAWARGTPVAGGMWDYLNAPQTPATTEKEASEFRS